MATILSLAEYKIAKNITTTDYDVQLASLIGMADSWIESYCNRVFGSGTYTEQYQGVLDSNGRYFFKVKNKPITSITSIDIHFFGVSEALSVDVDELDVFNAFGYAYYSWVLDPSIAVIRVEYRNSFYYNITYVGGESAIPAAVQMAATYIISNTFEYLNRTNSATASGVANVGELSGVKIGSYSETYETSERIFTKLHSGDIGLVLTPTVKALLDPYVSKGQNLK